MQMVAASKMRRAQEQVLATRPYTEKAWQILSNLAAQRGVDETVHPLLELREEIKTIGMVFITADKGLCGSYNHNMIQAGARFIAEMSYPVELITVGKRGRDALWRMRQTIVAEFSELPPQPRLLDVTPIARTVMDGFVAGHYPPAAPGQHGDL
jgi:F-type H+-transporting ATPase subunit gamma